MRIGIIGGGFCGSLCAKKLEKRFDVTLIDNKDFFEFTPSIPRVLCDYDYRNKIQVKHTDYLRKAKVIISKVDEIGEGYLIVGSKKLNFDYIIVSTGSSYHVPFKSKVVSTLSRSRGLLRIANQLRNVDEILIVGGGVVGVEAAAEILTRTSKNVILVHSHNRLMHRYPKKVGDYAMKFLENRGCKILLNNRITSHKGGWFITDKKNKFKPGLALLCTGITPNFNFKSNVASDEYGFLIVGSTLKIGNKIYAGGDIINIMEEKTAQNARNHASLICKNLEREIKGKSLCDYRTKKTPMVISLGSNHGIFFYNNFAFKGYTPSLMKKFIEKRVMIGYKLF